MTPKQEAEDRRKRANARARKAAKAFSLFEQSYVALEDLWRGDPEDALVNATLDRMAGMSHSLQGMVRELEQEAERAKQEGGEA